MTLQISLLSLSSPSENGVGIPVILVHAILINFSEIILLFCLFFIELLLKDFSDCQLLNYGLNSLLRDYPILLCISKAMSVNWSVSLSAQVLISRLQKLSVVLACITRFRAEVVGAPWNPPSPPSLSYPQNFNLVSSYNSYKLIMWQNTG